MIPPPDRSGTTTSTEVPLYWCAYGRSGAPRVLVLHGGPGAHHDYLLPQMLALADEYEMLFYDQRGGGRSRTDDRTPIGWRTHVEDLAAVASELAVDPLVVVGYSWGGLLALLHALGSRASSAPSAPSTPPFPPPAALALIDPAPISRAYREEFEREFSRRQQADAIVRLRQELAASGLRERDPEAYRQRNFELGVTGYFFDPEKARDLTPFRVTGRVQQSVWESLGDYDLAPRLPTLADLPALIVHGRQDPIPLASSEAAARAMGAELVVLDRCGHVPYVEQPASLFGELRRFLSSHAAPR
jgi:proline iminopeptidase